MKNEPLRIGIVGVGRFGSRHLDKWLQLDDVKVVGFNDIDIDVRECIEKIHHIPCLPLDDLIERVDILDIVVPAVSHYPIAEKALAAGKHIFIEKPFTETPEQADHLAAIADLKGVNIGIGHIERFNPVYAALKENLDGITPLSLHAYRQGPFIPDLGLDVSIIMELMVHDIDIALQLIPSPLKNIRASGEIIHSDKIDRATAVLEFENGSTATLFASRAEENRRRELICLTRSHTYRANLMERRLDISGTDKSYSYDIYDAMSEELKAFAASVREGRMHLINETDGTSIIRIADEIERKIIRDLT